jgi:hypothetical protein
MRTSHFCAGLALLCAMVACASEPIENSGEVRYTILSVRPLTDAEKASFQDVAGLNIAVRYRLSNETDHWISYLAESSSISPAGYRLYRKIGTSEWNSTNPSRAKSGAPGSDLKADTLLHRWIEFPRHAAIELELFDSASGEEEHAYSVIIKDGDKEYEKISQAFLPVAK